MNGPTNIPVAINAVTSMAITKNTAMYTDPINASGLDEFALTIILSGTGAVSCKVELEQGVALPAVANAADAGWVVPNGLSDIVSNLAVKTTKHYAISPLSIKYFRFKITELTNVSNDTVAVASVSGMNRFGQ